jgi:MoaA/NifB/PqqE/SkfB family radical SAM enzyme|tara:strand:+ start:343 stop:951 length:609 start_codon:yes stop_codon:yes gene_type:complete
MTTPSLKESNWDLVIDASNLCSLQCPKCIRSNIKKVPGETLTVDRFKKLIKYFNRSITFSGQISDPVMNPHLPIFLKILHEENIFSGIHTASSYRNLDWYEIAYNNNLKTRWVFGLDGLPNESHLYRKKQDGYKIFEAMKLGASKGMQIIWQYIVFKYNENHIEESKQLAKDNNITFELNISSRWDGPDDPLIPSNKLYVKK